MTPRPELAVADAEQSQRFRLLFVAGALLMAAAVAGPLAGALVSSGRALTAVFLAAALAPLVLWRIPAAPVVIMVGASTAIERFMDPSPDSLTGRIPFFRSFAESYGIAGAVILPVEMLMALGLLIWLARAIATRRLSLRPSHVGVGVGLVLLLAMFVAEPLGLAGGAVFNISLWELRPFVYLGVTYLLASQLVGSRAVLEAMLWGIVAGTAIHGIVGTERFFTMGNVVPRPNSLLEHDESFFFSLYILLAVALWVFRKRGALRWTATALLPFVLVADLGNNRRVAWVILPAMLAILAGVAYQRFPQRRRTTLTVIGVCLLLGAGYVAVFRNSDAVIAEPANAIWSQYRPSARDQSSDLYRTLENANLGRDIQAVPVVGTGYGVPIEHPIPLFDATSLDPLINFIPHNTVLYIWLRMGSIGMVAFFWMVGAAVVAAGRLARHPDRDLGLLGTVAACAVVGWLLQGWYDKGIVSFRIVILVGCLMGAVGAARRLGAVLGVPREAGARDGRRRAAASGRARRRVLPFRPDVAAASSARS